MSVKIIGTGVRALAFVAGSLAILPSAQALNFTFGDDGEATTNTTITLGAGWRMQDRAADLVGKGNLMTLPRFDVQQAMRP